MPIALCPLAQMNISLSNAEVKTPSLMSSSFNFKYQNLVVSASSHTYFCSFHTSLLLASFGGLTYTVRSIALLCENVVLISHKFNVHFFHAIIEQVRRRPSVTRWTACSEVLFLFKTSST